MRPDLQISLEQAISAQNNGQLSEAKRLYLYVLQSLPKHPEANHNMGILLSNFGDKIGAKQHFKVALSSKPNVSQFWLSYINILIDIGYLHEAGLVLKKAESLGIKGKAIDNIKYKFLSSNLAISDEIIDTITKLSTQSKHEEVVRYGNQVLVNFPNSFFTINSIATSLSQLGRFDEALQKYDRLLRINPNAVDVYNNMALCLHQKGENAEAIKKYKLLLEKHPTHSKALNGLGNAYKFSGDLDSAIKMYKKAIENKPDYSEALMNQSFAYLAQRNFADGWWRYEYRLKVGQIRLTVADIPSQPQWKPGLKGRVLLWAEQGLGDMIMFSSIIWELYAVVEELIIQVDERLIELFKRSFPSDIVYYTTKQTVPAGLCDFQIPLGSLPQYFRTDLNSFQKTSSGFLKSNKEKSVKLRKELVSGDNIILIGLSWKGGVGLNARIKSLELSRIIEALPHTNVKFVNLQYGDTQQECDDLKKSTGIEIHNVANIDNKNDIDGLVSLIDACDHVITISNVTAHLAGAIGKNTSIMLALSYDWRWGVGQSTSYWYSSLKLYQQKKLNNWDHPLSKLRRESQL
jgi:tetratricopeptide (TPR) repeat protein/ADP-heptose:LPS heptosyltransferase